MHKFSVLIANYNNGNYLEIDIKSAFVQTYFSEKIDDEIVGSIFKTLKNKENS